MCNPGAVSAFSVSSMRALSRFKRWADFFATTVATVVADDDGDEDDDRGDGDDRHDVSNVTTLGAKNRMRQSRC